MRALTDPKPTVRVITACTGAKRIKVPSPLTFDELNILRSGGKVPRAAALPSIEAGVLYTGRQHTLLMEGVHRARPFMDVHLHIVSAGYGVVGETTELYPYEATFSGKSPKTIARMAAITGIPQAMQRLLTIEKATCTLLLLGSAYLKAAQLGDCVVDARTIVLSAASAEPHVPKGALFVPLGMEHARRYHSTLVALKGLLGARFLTALTAITPPSLPVTADQFHQMVTQ